jgi:hypothetical protein
MNFQTNKINRNFNIQVRLYHNPSSFNTGATEEKTPRFFILPYKINWIEKIAFTNKSTSNGYQKQGNKFYANKGDHKINDLAVEQIFEDLKLSYPYGYRGSDQSSVQKYNVDFWYNDAYQSHLKSYWNKHSDKIKSHYTDIPTWMGKDISALKYIEVNLDEVITTKHISNASSVPSVQGAGPSTEVAYSDPISYTSELSYLKCSEKVVDVSYKDRNEDLETFRFHVDGDEAKYLVLNTGVHYALRFVEPWPTGSNGAHEPRNFRFSNVDDGSNFIWQDINGLLQTGVEWTSGYANLFDHETVSHEVTVAGGKFYIDGSQTPTLTFKRGSSYTFSQTGVSNDGHPFYISTGSVGGESAGWGVSDEYCEVQTVNEDYGVSGKIVFKVPFDAPAQLYYNCRHHENMGGSITVTDPTTSTAIADSPAESSFVPGNGLDVYLSADVPSKTYYYYCSGEMGIGGALFFSNKCQEKCPYDTADSLYHEHTTGPV